MLRIRLCIGHEVIGGARTFCEDGESSSPQMRRTGNWLTYFAMYEIVVVVAAAAAAVVVVAIVVVGGGEGLLATSSAGAIVCAITTKCIEYIPRMRGNVYDYVWRIVFLLVVPSRSVPAPCGPNSTPRSRPYCP